MNVWITSPCHKAGEPQAQRPESYLQIFSPCLAVERDEPSVEGRQIEAAVPDPRRELEQAPGPERPVPAEGRAQAKAEGTPEAPGVIAERRPFDSPKVSLRRLDGSTESGAVRVWRRHRPSG